jgi:hypothetical protein
VAKFQPGQGGRPRGARNRLARKFLDDLLEDWEEHGAGAIKIMRIEDPAKYVTIVAQVLPREFELNIGPIESELADDALDALIEALGKRQQALQQPAPPLLELKPEANENGKDTAATAATTATDEPDPRRPTTRAISSASGPTES